jgi:DNA-binding response OmpR family regulator
MNSIVMLDKKILIVDDERDFGVLMKSFFIKKSYEVFLAYSIAEGMDILEKEKPDYVFLDNNLPDGLGWEKTEYILHQYPQSQLHLISANEVPKTSSSAFFILYKPAIQEELIKLFGNS